jgi:hypothetical protein
MPLFVSEPSHAARPKTTADQLQRRPSTSASAIWRQQTHTPKGKIRNFDAGEPSLVANRGHADLNAHPWMAELQSAKAR